MEGNDRGVIYGNISEFRVKGLREITYTPDIVSFVRNWKKDVSTTTEATNKMLQFPLTDLFVDIFEVAVHVSGGKLVHLQVHFFTVYTVKKCC